jgi:hypothetical protein
MTARDPEVDNRAPVPNLFLVGAMKSGTTSAHTYLARHDRVYAPPIKEPNFFCTDLHRHRHRVMERTIHAFAGLRQIAERSEYLALYAPAPADTRYRLDSSPSYLYSAEAAQNIAAFDPAARIIILLRDPVRRAWSEYRMNQAIGLETQDFRAAVDRERRELAAGRTFLLKRYMAAGLYGDQVERYLRLFPKERVFIDVVDRPGLGLAPVLDRLTRFLGLSSDQNIEIVRENEARAPRRQKLNNLLYFTGLKGLVSRSVPAGVKSRAKRAYYDPDHATISRSDDAFLRPLFEASNRKLAAIAGVDVQHWLEGAP